MLELPAKGFTDTERAWLEGLLAELRSVRAIAGAGIQVSDNADGQEISADECDCDLCP
jgi:hypothetical protein